MIIAMKKITLFLFCLLLIKVQAQNCQLISGNSIVCLGNTSSFHVQFDAGFVASSYKWNFGDGATSTQTAPVYQYPSRGNFTPQVTVKFSNGSACTVNGNAILVVDKPKANFSVLSEDTQCFKGNEICIKDLSVPGKDLTPLKTRVLLFGDGLFDNSAPGSSDNICHSYTSLLGGQYNLVMEVTDTNGCLDRFEIQKAFLLYPKIPDLSFSPNFVPTCNQTFVTIVNTSLLAPNQLKKYTWDLGDGSPLLQSPWTNVTHTYTQVGSFDISLFVEDLNGCKDTLVLKSAVSNYKLDSTIYLNNQKACFRGNSFNFTSKNMDPIQLNWTIYKQGEPIRIDSFDNNPLNFPKRMKSCGKYLVSMYAQIGNCKIKVDTTIEILGPQAIIQTTKDPIINQSQCEVHDTVRFRGPAIDHSCLYSNNALYRIWDFDDAFAPPCTTDTRNGINLNRNCNYSKDSTPVVHAYKPGQEKCYFPKLILTDLITGCTDTSAASMKLTAPDAGWDSLSTPIRPGLMYAGNICMDSPIDFLLQKTLPLCGREKAWINFDSTCGANNWTEVDSNSNQTSHFYSETCNPDGFVTVGLIIKNGTDKNGNPCYDTAWYHNMIRLLPLKPAFTVENLNGGCGPWKVKLTFKDSIQDSLVRVRINWNNQQITTIEFGPKDTVIPSQYFQFVTPGLKQISVYMLNTRSCSKTSNFQIPLGFIKSISIPPPVACLNAPLKLQEYVQYFNSTREYWKEPARAAAGKEQLIWDFGEGKGFTTLGSNPSYQYSRPGNFQIRMIAIDSMGCRDTAILAKKIKVVDLKAQIKPMLPRYLCAPQILSFTDLSYVIDSSKLYGSASPYDNINAWTWEFGENKNPIYVQNPVYDYTSNGLFYARLKVQSAAGCIAIDSTPVFIDGPKPSFTISDTLGCAPFTVKLTNTTGKQLLNWVWFFRDYNNSILSTQKDTAVSFTYPSPGIFKIYLMGEEDLIDPVTGRNKTCRSVFPDSNNVNAPIRKVRVLPTSKLSLYAPDTVCKNQAFELVGSSPQKLPGFTWMFGDGNKQNQIWPDSSLSHTYTDTGWFRVDLVPQLQEGLCIDTAHKVIFATQVKADFDLDESNFPQVKLFNKSVNAVRYEWDFGQGHAGASNFSTDKDPIHTYKADTGSSFQICLRAYASNDCYDSLCKNTTPKVLLVIPNVFTPNNDNKNDAFDINMLGGNFYELNIYNRWGELVYESEKDGIGNDGINWNGNNHQTGEPCPEGVYYYIFNYRLITQPSVRNARGSITLIRD